MPLFPRGSEPRAGFSRRDAEAGASRRPPSRPAPPRRRYKARVLPFRTPPPAATESPVAGPAMLVAAALALCLLLASPGLAWYKPTAGQGYYSVGRAAGLLSGFHRSPYARRSEPRGGTRSLGGVGTFREMRPNLRSLVSNGRCWVRRAGGCGCPLILPSHLAPRPCASRRSPPTCRAASHSPTAAPLSSARPTSSCRSAPRTVASEPRPRHLDPA